MIPIFRPDLGDAELAEVKDSFDSHWIGLGPKTKQFEKNFAEYVGCKHAISVNSCTAALHLALLACDVREGDEVLVSAVTFASSAHVVIMCGATPILVDIDEKTLQMDVADARKKISEKTKAIIPVHYGGHPCDMDAIIALAREHGLSVIEDAANCAGASYKGKKIGALGSDFTCFSFEAKKNMTTGDGGMICTNKEGAVIDKIRRMRWVGMDKDTLKRFGQESAQPWEYDITELGFKYNMNDITAAIGLVQLTRLDQMNDQRRKIIERYNHAFRDVSWLRVPEEDPSVHGGFWLYTLRIIGADRDTFMRHLLDNGVLANTNFKPLHLFTFYQDYYSKKDIPVACPVAEKAWKQLAVLPLFPGMDQETIQKVIDVVLSFKESG